MTTIIIKVFFASLYFCRTEQTPACQKIQKNKAICSEVEMKLKEIIL
jgi:hypothetical protein